ncbi:MAG: thioredoxin family protein [Chthoniobacterales bacterium]|nr:thioredoxin family protein [Chthoniobacterales bacterium]
MALTESTPLGPDFTMPDFLLPDVSSGESLSAAACAGENGTVVTFLCRHCPYVVHMLPELISIARGYLPRGIAFVGISANNIATHPEDAPEKLAAMIRERAIPFPVLYDESQDTARAFHAVCTPEFYIFDRSARLHYHGRMDASTPGNGVAVTGSDFRAALDALLGGHPAPSPQHPSMGCNIKWK